MTDLAIIFLVLFLAALVALFVVSHRRQSRRILALAAEEEAILAEERRMFGFLHDLGEALFRDSTLSGMHKLIVEGALRVTESTGGAVYLWDAEKQRLVPRYCSDGCAPLVPLEERVLAAARENPSSLLSYLRLQSIAADTGAPGRVFQEQKAALLPDLARDASLAPAPANHHQTGISAMVSPLSCGSRQIGVLAVTAPASARSYSQNDFEVFQSLAEQSAFALANAIAHQEASEKRQIEAELRSASEIQRVLLPERDPELERFVIAGRNIPARVLSGDYYDYLALDENHLGVVIADVSGKGTAAALITAMCRSVLRANAASTTSPAAVLAAVNRQLYPDIREDMFISMIYMVLDRPSGRVTLARAGHTFPLLWRAASGQVEEIKSGGLAAGIDRGDVFERVTREVSFTMEAGDCLLLYTDGVNEAEDARGEEFGEERIKSSLAESAPLGARAVIERLIAALDTYTAGRRSHDDITLIALQKTA